MVGRPRSGRRGRSVERQITSERGPGFLERDTKIIRPGGTFQRQFVEQRGPIPGFRGGPVRGGFGVVGFVDTGNVFAHAADVDLTQLRTAVGGGIRYRSPIGPLRVDLGFKVNRHPGEGLTAWFISFGQAF